MHIVYLLLPLFFIGVAATDFKYQDAFPNYAYQFPRDHFDHPDYRTEFGGQSNPKKGVGFWGWMDEIFVSNMGKSWP